MTLRTLLAITTALVCANASTTEAQGAFRMLTVEEAVNEAVDRNLALLAEKANLSIAEAGLVSARLRPNPVLSGGGAMLQYGGSVKTAELALAQARLKLLTLLGRQPDDMPVDIVDPLGIPPAGSGPSLAVLQQAARAARPDLVGLHRDQARTQADLRLQIAQGKVDYTLGAEYRREQGVNGRGNTLGLFVSVPLPVFNRNQGEIARAEAAQEKASRSLTAAETEIAGEVAGAYQEFQSARELLLDIERDLLMPTQEARTGVTYMYPAGATSLLDVLDAQRSFNDTMETYYSAQAAYRRRPGLLWP